MQDLKSKTLEFEYHSSLRKKRLGQFFTGSRLARLLATLANAEHSDSAIDPMAGTGDMLEVVRSLNPNVKLSGIEIDKDVFAHASKRLKASDANLIRGSAFSQKKLSLLRKNNFDLVITNPPYVRYQSNAETSGDIPSASKVRQELLECVDLLTDAKDRHLFREIIKSYSGLSDLAVPAWILAAMLTKEGGTLALVVPESWLSRDYAQIIQYILLRWFKVKYIVEDSNAAWFSDALVKTTLLVAERIPRRDSAFSWKIDKYAHIKISAAAGTEESIVGNIYPHTFSPEKAFTKEVDSLLASGKDKESGMWSLELFSLSEIGENLKMCSAQWLRNIEDVKIETIRKMNTPPQIRRLLANNTVELTTLDHFGVAVGQGLRTGANSFFYVDLLKRGASQSLVKSSQVLGIDPVYVPTKFLKPVIRKQAELPDGFLLKRTALKSRVLIIPNDWKVSGDLAKLIRKAERTRVGNNLIPELSAVKTNIRVGASWYVLPNLAPRHTPEIFIPRVNSNTPRSYLNEAGLIVDANFSSVWLEAKSVLTPAALLALLNSSWTKAIMELSGAVMGGGALKLEATHIKRIPFPVLNTAQIKKLDRLGKKLTNSTNSAILRGIDEAVAGVLFEKDVLPEKLQQLDKLISKRRDERTKKQ